MKIGKLTTAIPPLGTFVLEELDISPVELREFFQEIQKLGQTQGEPQPIKEPKPTEIKR